MTDATLGKAYVQIIPSAKGICGMLKKELSGEAEQAGDSAGKSIASRIKSAILGAGIGTALGMAFKTAISEGAKLEQSIGGIETLFKESAGQMKKYAQDAFKTAGLSANDFMEQATSFAAGLISSTGGDTQKAAEIANMALIDMSDNANKMGSDMESLQNAYQGFAKQNYTMLDNLKLGYGGTKEEMRRLLEDAQKLTGVKYDIDNLSDVYSAIHAIQNNLDITGTTAKEAKTTFTGSFNMMKASAMNLFGYMATGMDLGPAIHDLVSSAGVFIFDNFLPMIGQVAVEIPEVLYEGLKAAIPKAIKAGKEFIENFGKSISEEIPALSGIFDNLVPLIEAVGAAFLTWKVGGIISDIGSKISGVFSTTNTFFKLLGNGGGIIENFGLVLSQGTGGLAKFGENIVNAGGGLKGLGSALTSLAGGPIGLIVAGISAAVAAVIYFYNTNEEFRNFINGCWENIKNTCKSLCDGIASFFGELPEKMGQVVNSIVGWWNSLVESGSNIWNGFLDTISEIWNGLCDACSGAWEFISNVVQVGITAIKEILVGAFQLINMPWLFIWENCKEYIFAAWDAIDEYVYSAIEAVRKTIEDIWNKISRETTEIWNGVSTFFSDIWKKIKTTISKEIESIKSKIETVWNGIKSFFLSSLNMISNTFSSVWTAVSSKTSSAFNSVKSTVSSIWNGIFSSISGVVNGIKNIIVNIWDMIHSKTSSVFNNVRSNVSNIWNGIKEAITRPIESAKNTVLSIIDRISSILSGAHFNLPHIKLPHFSIEGRFSLNPPSVPHLAISWYGKAMDSGMILNSPTIFGYDGTSLLGGGEAGPEAVVGVDSLQRMIQDAVERSSAKDSLDYDQMESCFRKAVEGLVIEAVFKLDSRTLAKLLAKPLDQELNKLAVQR